jgi:glycosyltransferase involved in cell wall biosynthesis
LFTAVDPGLPTKGLDLLKDALCEIALAQPHRQLTLHIVGNPIKHQAPLENLAFEYHGYLTHESLRKLFREVDLVVVPSRIDNSPSVVSEAQISGALVLGTNVGGISELIEDSVTGFLCEPNTESLRESILRVIASEQCYEISKAGQECALMRHDSNEIVAAHVSLYQKIVENG